MFNIKDVTNYSFTYTCDCGTIGRCMFVPVTVSGSIVMDLRCPVCEKNERICLIERSFDDTLRWAIILDNDVEDVDI